ncbi:MAG: choice-of-anchor V domain-containing protein, partial [Myxococcota bacterium]|nr:choice-of-anchor V domain-containing protein [Myxococcota bacterium]MEC8425167.1 choice-of-anchor V domain-containing protein [Myxococcota bacterium]
SGGILDAGPDTWVDDGELTHDRRQEMNDGRHVFAFAWTAPADPGPHLFWGAGNAVDAGGTARGDGWALAPVLSIEVDCALGACDGTDTAASAAADGVEPDPSGSATGCRTGPSPSGLAAVLGALWIAGRRPPRSRVSRLRRSPSASAP